MRSPRCASLLLLLLLSPLLLTVPAGDAAVLTGICDKDAQCGEGMCCAVSAWAKGLRTCLSLGRAGDSCHPRSHKVPYLGQRMHHTCPCMPGLACVQDSSDQFVCSAQSNPFRVGT